MIDLLFCNWIVEVDIIWVAFEPVDESLKNLKVHFISDKNNWNYLAIK